MASQELIGRYQRYKHGTRNLVYWLTKTAASCGDLETVLKSFQPNSTSKKRTLVAPELEVRAHELMALARLIAENGRSVGMEVPEGMLLIVQDVIAGREECAAWYAGQALKSGSGTQKEDEGHRGFIEILRDVLEILKGFRASTSAAGVGDEQDTNTSAKKKKGRKKKDVKLSGMFEDLHLEEPGENPLGDAPAVTILRAGAQPTSIKLKLEQQEGDAAFKIWCFLQDLCDVRTYIRETWQDFKDGELSFMAASLITDTAFGLMRRADENFRAISPTKSTEWRQILQYLGLTMFTYKSGAWVRPNPGQGEVSSPRGTESKSNIDIVEVLCPLAYILLEQHQKCAKGFSEAVKSGRQDFSKVPVPLCPHALETAMYGILGTVHYESKLQHSEADGHSDEYVQGLIDLYKTGKIHVWMVTACQSYLDIFDILGTNIAQIGASAVQSCDLLFQQTFDDFMNLRDEDNRLYMNEDMVPVLLRLAATRINLSKANRLETGEEGMTEGAEKDASWIEQGALPAFAGCRAAVAKLVVYQTGLSIAAHENAVISMAHLYKSLRAQGSLKTEWQDMEFFLAAFGKKQPLVTPIDKVYDGNQAIKRYMLALGATSRDVNAASKLPESATMVKRPARSLTITSPLLHALLDCTSDGTMTHRRYGVRTDLVTAVLEGVSDRTAGGKGKGGDGSSSKGQGFAAVQLLTSMRQHLVREEPLVNFDFAGFTLSCTHLLRGLAADYTEWVLPRDHKPDPLCHSFVGMAMYNASTNPITPSIAGAIDLHISTNAQGKVFVKRAYDQSSGRIPKELRPQLEDNIDNMVFAERIKTMLGDDPTKVSVSGKRYAAYHPTVEPVDAEYDSPFPRGIGSKVFAHLPDEQRRILYMYLSVMCNIVKQYRSRKLADESVRKAATSTVGLELVKVPPDAEGLEWAYVVPPEDSFHESLLLGAAEGKSKEEVEEMKEKTFQMPVRMPEEHPEGILIAP